MRCFATWQTVNLETLLLTAMKPPNTASCGFSNSVPSVSADAPRSCPATNLLKRVSKGLGAARLRSLLRTTRVHEPGVVGVSKPAYLFHGGTTRFIRA
jgi:hypothetical protein